MNQQAVKLLQELYTLVRDDASAITYQSMSQYRSALLKEITARIKTAVGAEAEIPAGVQARAADEGGQIEIGCFSADGEIQQLKPLSIDQARGLIKEIEESISDVITRDASAALGSAGPSP